MGLISYLKKKIIAFNCYFIKKDDSIIKFIKELKRSTSFMHLSLLFRIFYIRTYKLLSSLKVVYLLQASLPSFVHLLSVVFRLSQGFLEKLSVSVMPLYGVFLLIINHFLSFYSILLTMRVMCELFPLVNAYKNPITDFICFMTDPYFRIVDRALQRLQSDGKFAILSYFLSEPIVTLAKRLLLVYITQRWHVPCHSYISKLNIVTNDEKYRILIR
jgi:hypothetical protein